MTIIGKIKVRSAAGMMMVLSSCVIVFHLLVLSGVIPYKTVWGGRLENASQMHVFEAVSIIVNLAIIAIAGIKGGYLKFRLPPRIVTALLWILVLLFSLNTVGNLAAKTSLETLLFTPLTFMSAVLCYRMAIER